MLKIALCGSSADEMRIIGDLWYWTLFDREDIKLQYFTTVESIVKVFGKNGVYPDLVILDFNMELESDRTLVKTIRKSSVWTEIVLYGEIDEEERKQYSFAMAVLEKPLDVRTMVRTAVGFYNLRTGDESQSVVVSVRGNGYTLPLRKVRYFESNARKITAVMEHEELQFYMKLDELELLIRGIHFIRCHQRYLVNSGIIAGMEGHTLILDNGQGLPVSKRYYKEVKKLTEE